MRKRLLITVLAIMMLIPATAGAAPPDNFEQDDFTWVYDFENNLVVFWNVTREAYCDWLVANPETRPPTPEVVEPIPFQVVYANNGYLRVSHRATSHIELWQLAGNEPGEGCEPIVGTDPWAVGSASVSLAVLIDDGVGDIRHKLDGYGKVTDATSGEWHYSFTSLWFPDRGDFRPVQEFNLSPLAN